MKILKQRPYIVDESTWACPQHIPTLKMPIACERCWMCTNTRPKTEAEMKVIRIVRAKDKNTPHLCAWEQCVQGEKNSRAFKREKSKYCSTYCKNANARHRYKLRKENS